MMTTTTNTKTTYLALCGLFAALTTICSWISIPLGFTPVPVNLATLAVFLTGGLLGPKYGTISMTVYTLAGAVGIPVFSEFRGGVGVLAGPTGGYIIGYIAATFITGLLINVLLKKMTPNPVTIDSDDHTDRESDALRTVQAKSKGRRTTYGMIVSAVAMICGLAACYVLGTAWFMFSTNTGLAASMAFCVIPFLPGDALKIIAGAILVQRLRPHVLR